MVAAAPRIERALPAFLEFVGGSVLVAHNAPFDVGFLRRPAPAPAARGRVAVRGHRAAGPPGADPRRGARLPAGHAVALLRTRTKPNHRALADARATVDVLHGLLERLGPLGVQSLDELRSVHRAGPRGAGASATWPRTCPACRASTCSGTPPAGRCTSAPARTSGPGCGSTSWPARSAPGWPRWSRWPSGSTRSSARTRSRRRFASSG